MAKAHVAETPVNLNVDNGAAITTAVSFTVASNRTVYAVQFWGPTTNSGTYTVELWEITGDDDPGPAGGTLLQSASIASADVTPGAWNRVAITPQAVVTTKVYRAARHASSGRYVSTSGAFTGASISNAGITLVESGSNPGGLFGGVLRNGTFREGAAGNYPASSFGAADYFVDVDDEDDTPEAITGVLAASPPLPTAAFTGVEAMSGALLAFPPLPTCAITGTVIVPVTAVLSAVAAAPTAAITGYTPVVERPASFEPLLDMVRTARRNAGVRVRATACPKCGEPLEAARGVLHCRWDGSVY